MKNLFSVPFESMTELEAAMSAVYGAHQAGHVVPFANGEERLPGAEVFISLDRAVMLVRAYDIVTDTFKWRVRAQISSSTEALPLSSVTPTPDGCGTRVGASPSAPENAGAASVTTDTLGSVTLEMDVREPVSHDVEL